MDSPRKPLTAENGTPAKGERRLLPLSFVVTVEGLAQTIEKVAVFDLPALRSVHVGPEPSARLRIEQGNARVTRRDWLFAECVDALARGELPLRNRPDVVTIVEPQDKVGFFAAFGEFKAAPLGQFKDRAVLELVEAGFILEENKARPDDRVRKRFWTGPKLQRGQG